MIRVVLTEQEIAWGEEIGRRRRESSSGLRERFPPELATGAGGVGRGLERDGMGAKGELAVALALGVEWPASVNTFRSVPDVPPNVDVKTRSGRRDLIVSRDHPRGRLLVLAWEIDAATYDVVGFCHSEEGFALGDVIRGETAFVPASRLRPIEELL